ncbi:MAG: hypothetical protein ACTSW1_11200 [Candidatus Hodarchaeales archaeon]
MILIKMTNEITNKDVVEGFELCDSPQWLMWILLSIGVIGLILITVYLFAGKKGKKNSRKR